MATTGSHPKKSHTQSKTEHPNIGKIIVDALASLPQLDLNELGGLTITVGGLEVEPPATGDLPVISEHEARQRVQRLVAEDRMPSLDTVASAVQHVCGDAPVTAGDMHDDVENDPDDPNERPVRFDPESGKRLKPGSPEHATAAERLDIQRDQHFCIWCGEPISIHYTGWSQWIDCGTLRRWREGTTARCTDRSVRHD